MRLALIIVCLTSIAVARVHLRRSQLLVRHDQQEQANRQIELRRALWDQQVRLGYQTAPDRIRQRAQEMALQRAAQAPAPGAPATPAAKPAGSGG